MSADSPTTDRNIFSYHNDRSTPPPTTSSYIPKYDVLPRSYRDRGADELAADKDPNENEDDKNKEDKDEEKDKDKQGPLGPGANPGYKQEEEAITKADKQGDKDDGKKHNMGSNMKLNGIDALDGKWTMPPPKVEDEDEDKCVKCLYYSMQCCECTIM